jgi:hypothetical protein
MQFSNPGVGKIFFPFLKTSRLAVGSTQPPIQYVPGGEGVISPVKAAAA